jgi:hypothetical protein
MQNPSSKGAVPRAATIYRNYCVPIDGQIGHGNADTWSDDAIGRALSIVEHAGLDIRLVSFGSIDAPMRAIAHRWE